MPNDNWVADNIRKLIADLESRLKTCHPNIKPALEAQLKEQRRQLKYVESHS